jgi:hypothetical protein
MIRPSILLFPLLLVVASFFAWSSTQDLPDIVAIHFDSGGLADGWTSRERYRILVLFALGAVPLLLVWLMAGLPRMTKGWGQIPNREYWLQKERRRETEMFLLAHACWLGSMTIAVVFGIHISILRANALTPPTLAMGRFAAMVGAYLIGLGWWASAFLRHFHEAHTKSS